MPDLERPPLFDARGNRYVVVSSPRVRGLGRLIDDPVAAASAHAEWTAEGIASFCLRSAADSGGGNEKPYWSDGLLVGPFPSTDGFGLIIVNTDGTIAERSGNGLTIFARFLIESGLANPEASFDIAVFHPNSPSGRLIAACCAATLDGDAGVWVDMGRPGFGPAVVGVSPAALNPAPGGERGEAEVLPLKRIDPSWTHSVFVNIGNPHCVTFVDGELPSMQRLRDELRPLEAIANSASAAERPGAGVVCKAGVNLQWARAVSGSELEARVFERGEGPTQSSGSSAVAVACAARYLGLVHTPEVLVRMPGGIAPIAFDADGGVHLFGQASSVPYGNES